MVKDFDNSLFFSRVAFVVLHAVFLGESGGFLRVNWCLAGLLGLGQVGLIANEHLEGSIALLGLAYPVLHFLESLPLCNIEQE